MVEVTQADRDADQVRNIYRHRFEGPCPNNDAVIDYSVEIETIRVVMVEEIVEACVKARDLPKPYHENIADYLFERFGGRQRMVAFHHGVEIETRRGP